MLTKAHLWKGIGTALLFLAGCGQSEPNPSPPTPASVNPTPDMSAMAPAPTPSMMPTPSMSPAPTPSMPAAPMTAAVSVMDDFFSPKQVTIAAGGTVTWTWMASASHTVTSDTGLFDSSPPKSSGTFSFTFPNAGTFPYHCLVHGFMMSGTVIVQ